MMKLGVTCSQLGLVVGILICWAEALPMDPEEVMNAGQMLAMNAAGTAMEMMQNANPHANMDVGFGSKGGSSASDDDRKRRRRSTFDNEDESVPHPPGKGEQRRKRSPCGRNRRTQSTPTTAPNGTGGAGGAAGTGGAAGAGGTAAGGAPGGGAAAAGPNADLPRRKRSPAENDIDENIDIIPVQRTFGEKTQQITEKFHQTAKEIFQKMSEMMSNVADAMAGMFDNITKSIQPASDPQSEQRDGK